MLRVEMHDCINGFIIRLGGRFSALSAEHLKTLVALGRTSMRLFIDLTHVTSVDPAGEAVLFWLGRTGYTFIATSPYSFEVCRRLDLPVASRTTGTIAALGCSR